MCHICTCTWVHAVEYGDGLRLLATTDFLQCTLCTARPAIHHPIGDRRYACGDGCGSPTTVPAPCAVWQKKRKGRREGKQDNAGRGARGGRGINDCFVGHGSARLRDQLGGGRRGKDGVCMYVYKGKLVAPCLVLVCSRLTRVIIDYYKT